MVLHTVSQFLLSVRPAYILLWEIDEKLHPFMMIHQGDLMFARHNFHNEIMDTAFKCTFNEIILGTITQQFIKLPWYVCSMYCNPIWHVPYKIYQVLRGLV